jgi:drug/metabolite transporter (DMT)-like permease
MGLSAALAASSNLLLRYAMGGLGGGGVEALPLLRSAVTSPLVLAGFIGYGVSQLLWLNVLADARLGAAFPVFISFTFVAVLGGSAVVLGEPLTGHRLGGAALVATGIVVAEWSRGERRRASEGAR